VHKIREDAVGRWLYRQDKTSRPMIFVDLPVADVSASRAFWTSLGYPVNEQFSDDRALGIVLGETITAMLLHTDYFKTLTILPVIDAKSSIQTLLALSCDSREGVDVLLAAALAALAAGAPEPREAQDLGFMYQRAFSDFDSHTWEIAWMDPAGYTAG